MNTILSKIGNTPLIRLCNIENETQAEIYAKLEYFNPFGSVKDRVAKQIIEDAEERGLIIKGSRIVEATSGNTGIALAAISALKGYGCTIIMPENSSSIRKKLIRLYGAELILTASEGGMAESVRYAKELSATNGVFYADQFSNRSSVDAHRNNTAPEIYTQLSGDIDVVIAGIGSGGTITGIAEFFKGLKCKTRVVGVLPKKAPHCITGIGAGFDPKILDYSIIDEIVRVCDDEACKGCSELLEKEGIFAGISSGAVFAAAKRIVKNERNKKIVMIFPDSGERYL